MKITDDSFNKTHFGPMNDKEGQLGGSAGREWEFLSAPERKDSTGSNKSTTRLPAPGPTHPPCFDLAFVLSRD